MTPSLKRCTRCKEWKPKQDFGKRKTGKEGLDAYCKICSREQGKAWQRANVERRRIISKRYRDKHRGKFRESQRRRDLRLKFGITPEDYERMFAMQNGICAICGRPPNDSGARHTATLMIDHDHKTGAVRGLLHSGCNLILGYAKDDPAVLLSAIRYLARFSAIGKVE